MFFHRFKWEFIRSSSERSSRTVVLDSVGGKSIGCLLDEPNHLCPVLPRPAPPCRLAVCRPASTQSWYVRVLDWTNKNDNISNPKPRHTTGGSGWGGARRGSGAGRGGAGWGSRHGTVRPEYNRPYCPQASKKTIFERRFRRTIKKSYVFRWGNKNSG